MSQVFSGTVLLPGETGDGLHASFEMDDERVRLIAGDDEIGSWERDRCDVAPSGRGSFQMALSGEVLSFAPTSPSAFAEAMAIPLAPETQTEAEGKKPKYDYDAAIDDIIARVMPLRDPSDDDEILSKPMLVGIVGLSTMVIAGLATVTVMI